MDYFYNNGDKFSKKKKQYYTILFPLFWNKLFLFQLGSFF